MVEPRHVYALDATGVCVVRNAFIPAAVAQIRDCMLAGRAPAELPWKFPVLHLGRAVWNALTHPAVLQLAEAACGPHFRLDHAFGLSSNGAPAQMHGGQWTSQWSNFAVSPRDGAFLYGQLVVGVCLRHQSPVTGGLCYIPGSHRAADKRDGREIIAGVLMDRFDPDLVIVPRLEPGDIVAFPEGIVHGDTGYHGDGPRLQLYYKFSPGWVAWRDPRQRDETIRYAETDLERRLVEPAWTGRYSEDQHTMDVTNELRPATL